MDLARWVPSLVLLLLLAAVAAPVAVALRMMSGAGGSARSAAGRAGAAVGTGRSVRLAGFDGARAFGYLAAQCRLGPRPAGSEASQRLRHMLVEHFKSCGAEVVLQPFESPHPLTHQPVPLANVVARWFGARKRRLLIAAHYDTRPYPDEEGDAGRRRLPFLGANDGASGVAVLMELAHLIPHLPTIHGVDLAAFDAEELVYGQTGDYFLGSRHFAQQYRQAGEGRGYRYEAAVVVDMVGDRRLTILPDRLSVERAGWLVQEVWSVARRLRVRAFRPGPGYDLRDDHLPLQQAGIPAIDIIDFDYPYWHRAGDTVDKCSARSLAQVGGVLAQWLRGK